MKSMKELREMMCEELEDIARKGELGAGDLEIVHKRTETMKSIDKIDMLESEGGYSSGGDWLARGMYDDGRSYRRQQRESRGRYSRDGAKDRMIGQLEDMMRETDTEKEKEAIRRCISALQSV